MIERKTTGSDLCIIIGGGGTELGFTFTVRGRSDEMTKIRELTMFCAANETIGVRLIVLFYKSKSNRSGSMRRSLIQNLR